MTWTLAIIAGVCLALGLVAAIVFRLPERIVNRAIDLVTR